MAATKTTYVDPRGNPATGYIIDGKTYKDPNGTVRIDAGSKVTAGGITYELGADGIGRIYTGNGASGETGYASNYNDIINMYMNRAGGVKDTLLSGRDSAATAVDSATARTLATYDAQRPAILSQEADANRAAYIANAQVQNPYGAAAEMYAAQGLGRSGVSESSRIASGNAYQAAVSQNQKTKADALNALENAKIQAQAEGDYQKASIIADYQSKLAELDANTAATVLQYQAQGINYDYQLKRDARSDYESDRSFNYTKAQNDTTNAENARATLAAQGFELLGMGMMPSADQLAAMGISAEKASAYITWLRTGK